jgi:hypothetical protein
MSHSDGEMCFIDQILQLLLQQAISQGIKVKPDRETGVIPAFPNMNIASQVIKRQRIRNA